MNQSAYNMTNATGMTTTAQPTTSGYSPVVQDQDLPQDYSQDFENLRIGSDEPHSPRRGAVPLPSVQLDIDSQGEVKIPGFSQPSQTRSVENSAPGAASGSGLNGKGKSVDKSNSRKRKTDQSSTEERDSSPLTEPPADSEDSSAESNRTHDLPTRPPKSHKKSAGDSPAIQSARPGSKAQGSGRAGTRKTGASAPRGTTRKTSDKGRGKAVESADNSGESGPSAKKASLRRSARNGAK
jgi:hypothetical protein